MAILAGFQDGSLPVPHTTIVDFGLTNRAGESESAYIRSHKNDLVAWQNWTAETLSLARSTGRLIFLNISFAACHWCNSMTRESFNNPSIAHKINSSFIPVMVDRDDRPDLDRIYMNYVQATTNTGGWPLNVFLTPTLAPIFGGTYFPPSDGMASFIGANTSATSGTTAQAGKFRRPSVVTGNVSPAFPVVLDRIYDSWVDDRKSCEESGRRMIAQLRGFAAEGMISREGRRESFLERQTTQRPSISDFRPLSDGPPPDQFVAFEEDPAQMLELDTLDEAYEHFTSRFDRSNGGFGFQPKFPCPTNLNFLLKLAVWPKPVEDLVGEEGVKNAQSMVLTTLKQMRKGGIWDQIGGGFHRYSASWNWLVPHFEKMIYDQALLLHCYLSAWLVTKDEVYLDVVLELVEYLLDGPFSSETGAFFSSQSADSLSPTTETMKEGAFYTWGLYQFQEVLGDDVGSILASYFGVSEEGNVLPEHDIFNQMEGLSVLSVSKSFEHIATATGHSVDEIKNIIAEGKKTLLDSRLSRDKPRTDPKIVAGWNGLTIGALSRVGSTLIASDRPDLQKVGRRAFDRAVLASEYLKSSIWNAQDKILYRRVSSETKIQLRAFAEDYAFMIWGLIELYQASCDPTWLEWATDLMESQISQFHDAQHEGFFSTVETSLAPKTKSSQNINLPDVILRLKDGMDTAEPSTNGLTAQNLFRLSSLLGNDEKYARLARRTIMAFEAEILQHPFLFTSMLGAVVAANESPGSIVVIQNGPASSEMEESKKKVTNILRSSNAVTVGANWTVVWANVGSSSPSQEWLGTRHPIVRATLEACQKSAIEGGNEGDGVSPAIKDGSTLTFPPSTSLVSSEPGVSILVYRPQAAISQGSPVLPRTCEKVTIDELPSVLSRS